MKDEQMMHLLRILQAPKCRIWCLNIGETYNVSHKTWSKFAKGLKHTKVTHMYGKFQIHSSCPCYQIGAITQRFLHVLITSLRAHNYIRAKEQISYRHSRQS